MAHSLFTASQFRENCASWQDAVRLACSPLEERQLISTAYAQAIIDATEKHGPWYILSPTFALPHARPHEGVLSQHTHLSLLTLKDPVAFQNHSDVRLIIVLAAADSHQHVDTIQRLMCWLDEGDRLHLLSTLRSAGQLHAALSSQA